MEDGPPGPSVARGLSSPQIHRLRLESHKPLTGVDTYPPQGTPSRTLPLSLGEVVLLGTPVGRRK
jgi:hypothetical protein